jgi:hypothetical protein
MTVRSSEKASDIRRQGSGLLTAPSARLQLERELA